MSDGIGKNIRLAGIFIMIIILSAALIFYFLRNRGLAAGASDFRNINDKMIRDLIVMETEWPDYPPDTEVIKIMIVNSSVTEPFVPATDRGDEWILEFYDEKSQTWRKTRHTGKNLCWDFYRKSYGQEDYGENIRPSGTVPAGGSLIYLCNLWAYYNPPLQSGRYRVIFPDIILASRHDLAAEFEIRDFTPEELETRANQVRDGWEEYDLENNLETTEEYMTDEA